MQIPVTNTDLMRDTDNRALLNINRDALDTYKTTHKKILNEKKELQNTKARLNRLEQEMSDLRAMISSLAIHSHESIELKEVTHGH